MLYICLTYLTQHIIQAPRNVVHPMLLKMTNPRVNKESHCRILVIAVESVAEEGKI